MGGREGRKVHLRHLNSNGNGNAKNGNGSENRLENNSKSNKAEDKDANEYEDIQFKWPKTQTPMTWTLHYNKFSIDLKI